MGDIQFFVYKKTPRRYTLGNPHIDTMNGVQHDVGFRFNVVLLGDEDTEMTWWNVDRNSPLVTSIMFPDPKNQMRGRLQAVGESMEDRHRAVGEPHWRSSTLTAKNQLASFVRTDILHAINWTGANPRFTLSVRFAKNWDLIESIRIATL